MLGLRSLAGKKDLPGSLDIYGAGTIVISLYGEICSMILRDFMAITKALADDNRVRVLLALRGGELCVCQITELFGLAASTISKHLSVLYQAGLVDSRKDGRWMYYSLPAKGGAAPARDAIRLVIKSLAEDSRAVEDAARLKRVLAIDPVELCKRQCRN
jgi:ArsR family transcriptional regulator, arsenate/arsenite/antimonite-responsive transcriptional repressor